MTRVLQISSMVVLLGLVWMPGPTVGQLSQIMAKLGISTVGSEPSILTAAEIEKLILIERSRIDEPLPVPAGKKPPDQSTIEIGPPGLNAAELAKANGAGAHAKSNKAAAD
jgi:hypothetical protein